MADINIHRGRVVVGNRAPREPNSGRTAAEVIEAWAVQIQFELQKERQARGDKIATESLLTKSDHLASHRGPSVTPAA